MSAVTYAEPPGPRPEIPPAGGDVTEGGVRIGDPVRRPLGPNAPLVHALPREAWRERPWRERPGAALDAALTAP
ncbi:hypothetical protein HCN51_26565 [Nonomuraea sp. FMUSA5-5]|uniref:Uncharacterized protein n=1 Tax=Nonomuraea composti TaxID=2720023 RepID=A0ABX1BB12_9ACTN|nr:hypothetical protein [Nonomuraea sp. FMUSA5-5]NJP92971.1 hypothetical protein [Nonomuraea sp. FMUSA5-5]